MRAQRCTLAVERFSFLLFSHSEIEEQKKKTEQAHWRMTERVSTSVDAHVVIAVERVAHAAARLGGGHGCSSRHWHGARHLAAKSPAHPPARWITW